MTLLELERHANGPRLRVVGQRIHHGALGAAGLLAVPSLLAHHHAAQAVILAACCAVAITDDRHDARQWFAAGAQRA